MAWVQKWAGFKKLIPKKTSVWRDGNVQVIDASELVPGDIVDMSDGDQVPADIALVWANECKVDNSSLTGESEPQDRSNVCGTDANGGEWERTPFGHVQPRLATRGSRVCVNSGQQQLSSRAFIRGAACGSLGLSRSSFYIEWTVPPLVSTLQWGRLLGFRTMAE